MFMYLADTLIFFYVNIFLLLSIEKSKLNTSFLTVLQSHEMSHLLIYFCDYTISYHQLQSTVSHMKKHVVRRFFLILLSPFFSSV